MKPQNSLYQASEPTQEVLDTLKERVLSLVCLRTSNPRVAALANKLCDQIDESYKNLEVDFEDPTALEKTAINAIKFWAVQANEDVKMNQRRPAFWISVALGDTETKSQMSAYKEFIQIASSM
ncbi:MAG: hypothetical protein EBU84_12115 [Actinobacteria bacterium]|nr:hypothetical protein [Actinomycetota bacterium]